MNPFSKALLNALMSPQQRHPELEAAMEEACVLEESKCILRAAASLDCSDIREYFADSVAHMVYTHDCLEAAELMLAFLKYNQLLGNAVTDFAARKEGVFSPRSSAIAAAEKVAVQKMQERVDLLKKKQELADDIAKSYPPADEKPAARSADPETSVSVSNVSYDSSGSSASTDCGSSAGGDCSSN